MKYDIKEITEWKAPKDNGVAILTMPNVPLPLHTLAPRTIMGQKKWDIVRKREYMRQDYTCAATGQVLGHGKCHLHELYSIDYAHQTAAFERYAVLDPALHTRFIHSGRAITLFEAGDKQMSRQGLLRTLEDGFALIAKYNTEHYEDEPLRVSATFLDWAKNPMLGRDVNGLIEKYKMKFYTFNKKYINAKNWGKWKLIYDGKEYKGKFATQEEWKEHFKDKFVMSTTVETVELTD